LTPKLTYPQAGNNPPPVGLDNFFSALPGAEVPATAKPMSSRKRPMADQPGAWRMSVLLGADYRARIICLRARSAHCLRA